MAQKRTLCNGTTTASYYTTIHLESSKELCRIIGTLCHKLSPVYFIYICMAVYYSTEEAGQRAFVGMRKISKKMDGAEYYVQDAGQCLEDTKKYAVICSLIPRPTCMFHFASCGPGTL